MSRILESLQNDEALSHMRRMMTNYKIGYGYINEAEDPTAGADPAAGAGVDTGDDAAAGDDPMAGGADPMAGGAAPMGGAAGAGMPMGGGMPGMPGADPNAAGAGAGASGQTQDQVNTNLAPAGADQAAPAPEPEETGEDEEDDNVEEIDVDELTDSQKDAEDKIEGLDQKFEKLLDKFNEFERMIDNNNQHIESLKAEMEKRNPTAQERAQQRVNLSSPYGVSPENFEPKLDPEVSATPRDQYTITDQDIEDTTDWNNIAKSMDRGFSLKDILDM